MKNRRQGARLPVMAAALSPALWLLVACLVVLLGPEVWAQTTQAQQGFGFPYLDTDPNRAKMLANAFVAQMGLFMGGVGGIPALTMLGAIAALIGGMSILFFRQFQPTIIAGWLLMVVVVIFVPLNSRLLFSPITVAEPQNVSTASGGRQTESNQNSSTGTATPVSHNGTSCVSNPRGCGFTPQLAAVHVTSIMQMVLSDLFRSTGWRGLMERQVADSMLRARPEFKLSEAWLRQNQRYVEQCSGQNNLGELIAGIQTSSRQRVSLNSNNNSVQGQPHRFDELWKLWGSEYANNKDHNEKPFIALLPDTIENAQRYGWGQPPNSLYSAYENALTQLINNFVPGSNVIVSFNASGSGQVSVAQALNALVESGFLTVSAIDRVTLTKESQDISVNPGFFMMPLWAAEKTDTPQALSRTCYMEDELFANGGTQFADRVIRETAGTITAGGVATNLNRQSCLNPIGGVFGAAAGTGAGILGVVGLANNAIQFGIGTLTNIGRDIGLGKTTLTPSEALNRQIIAGNPENHWTTYSFINRFLTKENNESATLTHPWSVFIRQYPAIASMPVIFGDINENNVKPINQFRVHGFQPLVRQNCKSLGQKLLNTAVKKIETTTNGGTQTDDYLVAYTGMLTGQNTNIPDNITIDTLLAGRITARDLELGNAGRYTLIKMLADDANNTLLTSGVRGGTPEAKRAALINRYIRLAQDVTAQAYPNINTNPVATLAAQDGRSMAIVGNQTLTEVAGSYMFWIGDKIIRAFSYFIGPVAMATIMFLNVAIDLAVFGVIVITPFLLLAGVLQPRKAIGYLIISVMVVFVLKFVPLSLIILNNIAGMVYELLPSALGMNAGLAQSMMILGMATIYMGLVGFTLYLLFKSGDPASTLGALANLDSAAKKAADAGLKYGLAAAGAGLALLGGVAGAALKSQLLKNAARKQLEKIPGVGTAMGLIEEQNNARNERNEKEEAEARANNRAAFVGPPEQEGPSFKDPTRFETPEERAWREATGENLGWNEKDFHQRRLDNMPSDMQDDLRASIEANNGPVQIGETPGGSKVMAEVRGGSLAAYLDPPPDETMPPPTPTASGGPGVPLNPEDGEDPVESDLPNGDENSELAKVVAAAPDGSGVVLVAGQQPGQPLPVDVVKGKLESIEKLPEVKMAESTDPNANLSREERIAQRAAEQQKVAEEQQTTDKVQELNQRIANAENDEVRDNLSKARAAELAGRPEDAKRFEQAAVDAATTEAERRQGLRAATMAELGLKRDANIKNYENQVQAWRSEVQSRIDQLNQLDKEGKISDDQIRARKGLEATLKDLDTTDGIAYGQRDHFKALSEKGDSVRRALLQSDILNMPSRSQSAMSALYGWGAGLFSGGGSIPIVGNVIREVANEYLQAPERAKAWNTAGGFGKWWKAGTKAQQLGYYNKEVAPLAAAAQYDAMGSLGMFEGNIRLAQQAATEAVAQSRSQFEALRYRLDKMDTDITNNVQLTDKRQFMTAADLYGMGMEQSVQRVNTVYQDALQGRDSMMQVVKAKYDDKDNYIGEDKENIRRTIEVMSEVSQRMIAKSYGGAMEATMLKYYGLFEKFNRPGEYENVRDSETRVAQLETARLDAEANYLVGGHINMVQGKADFFGYRGRYQAFTQLRNQTNTMLQDYIKQNAEALNVPMNITPQINQTAYAAAVKAATKAIGPMNLPLNALFDEAQSTGFANTIVKSRVARFNLDKLQSENDEAVAKAAKAAFSALNSDVDSKFGKKRTIEYARTRNELAEGRDELIGKIMYFGQIANQDVGRMIEIANKTASKHQASFQMNMEKIFKTDKDGKKVQKGIQAFQTTTKAYVEDFLKETQTQLGSAAAAAAAKVFKDLGNGKFEIAHAAIIENDDGTIETPVR